MNPSENKSEYPGFFARFYDLIYHSVRDGVDNTYFQDEIGKVKGKVLEIGTGTGRLLMTALNNGADIYGIDISPAMLEVLKKKMAEDQLFRVSRQNIIDFSFKCNFDLIIAPFRVFMHLNEKNDQLRALNNVYRHLNKGGRFIFDVFIPDLKALLNGIDHVTDFEGEYQPGRKIKRTVSTKPDLVNQIINLEFMFDWDEDGTIKREIWYSSLRYFFRFELEHLIERSEFKNYTIKGDYMGNNLNKDSKEFVITCIK